MAKPQTFGRLPNGSYFIVVDQNFPANLNRESAEIFRKLPTGIARDFDLAIKEVPRAEEPCLEGSPYSAYSIFIVNGHIYENSRMPATTKVLRLHDIVFYLFSKMELSRIDWSNITIPDMFLDLFSNQVSGSGTGVPLLLTQTTTFAELDEFDHFCAVDQPGYQEFDGGDHKADILVKRSRESMISSARMLYSHERGEGFRADARKKYYACDITGMIDTFEVSEQVVNPTKVIRLSPVFFELYQQISVPPEMIGPNPLNRPKIFFKAGDLVWVLQRSEETLKWTAATIASVFTNTSMGKVWGPFITLTEDLGIHPGSNGAIRFDSSDIWPRTK